MGNLRVESAGKTFINEDKERMRIIKGCNDNNDLVDIILNDGDHFWFHKTDTSKIIDSLIEVSGIKYKAR